MTGHAVTAVTWIWMARARLYDSIHIPVARTSDILLWLDQGGVTPPATES